MTIKTYSVIEDKFIVLNCVVGRNNITVVTEICPFCGERHFHKTGGTDWGEYVWIVNGIRTLHHRRAHCIPKNVEITLADGSVVCNDKGYFLGIRNEVPW